MNYLAHSHLSYSDDQLVIGSLLGDFVKGPLSGKYPLTIEQGILLHRQIDAFTDQHQLLKQCHRQFGKQFHRFASNMTDVAFDYYLSRHWQQFHHQSLKQFSTDIYGIIVDHPYLSGATQLHAERLAEYDVLNSYCHWHSVDHALRRIDQRIRFNTPLAAAAEELLLHDETVEQTFLAFYPLLQQFVEQQKAEFFKS